VEQIEKKTVVLHVVRVQVHVQVLAVHQTPWHEVVLYTFVLETAVYRFDVLEVLEREADQLVRLFALIVRDDQRAVKSIVAKQFKLLRVVVPCQCLLRALHVKNVKEEFGTVRVLISVERCAVDGEVGTDFVFVFVCR